MKKIAFLIPILALSSAAAAWAAPQATWSPTGSMAVGRFSFTATTLQNGKVLVAGAAIAVCFWLGGRLNRDGAAEPP